MLARGRAKAEVTFRRPIRVGKPYQTVAGTDGTKALEDGNDVLALVRDASVDLQVPRPVGLEASMVAAEQYMVIAGT